MAVKLTWDKSSSAYEAAEKVISKNKLYDNCDMLVEIKYKYSWESDDKYLTSNEILTFDTNGALAVWENDWWEGQQDVWVIAAAPIEEIELQDKWNIN